MLASRKRGGCLVGGGDTPPLLLLLLPASGLLRGRGKQQRLNVEPSRAPWWVPGLPDNTSCLCMWRFGAGQMVPSTRVACCRAGERCGGCRAGQALVAMSANDQILRRALRMGFVRAFCVSLIERRNDGVLPSAQEPERSHTALRLCPSAKSSR